MKIGITGASGKLGRGVINHLKARSPEADVVAISRTPERAEGLEGRFGDYNDRESLLAAYAGIDRLLLIPGDDLTPGARGRQTTSAVGAAVEAGVGHIVYVSSLSAGGVGVENAPKTENRASYFATEQALKRKAPKWTILRMAYFMEALIDEGQRMLPMGMLTGTSEAPVNFVSRDDLADVAAAVLASGGRAGETFSITGPKVYTGSQRAAAISQAAGQPLEFVAVTEEQLAGGMRRFGLDQLVIDTVLNIHQGFARGDFNVLTDHVARLAGREPVTLEAALELAFPTSV